MKNKTISRRRFLGTAAAATVLSSIPFNISYASNPQGKKPNSKVGGVQLGVTTYSYGSMPHKVDDCIQYLLYAGVNSIELRNVAEEDLGIPQVQRPARGVELTEKERADLAKAAGSLKEEQRKWRLSLPMERYADMRKKFNSAGIDVYITKFAPSAWSDEEIDYAYNAAKVLGSIGITDELTRSKLSCVWANLPKSTTAWQCSILTARLPIRASPSINTLHIHLQICSTSMPATITEQQVCIRTM